MERKKYMYGAEIRIALLELPGLHHDITSLKYIPLPWAIKN